MAQWVLAASDPCTNPNPYEVWGEFDAEDPSRQHTLQNERGIWYRNIAVHDGDDVYGERAELGHNEWRVGDRDSGWDNSAAPWIPRGTFVLNAEGQIKSHRFSIRLPKGFPTGTHDWANLGQWKQCEPYAKGQGNTPMGGLGCFDDRLHLMCSDPLGFDYQSVWSCPVETGRWMHFRHDALWSAGDNARQQLIVRLGATDYSSPVIERPNLLVCTVGGYGYQPGDSLRGHFRLGIYHNPVIGACDMDVRAIAVYKKGS